MSLRRVFTPLLLVAALFGTAPAPAHAQSAADVALARDLFKEGVKYAQQGQWNEARQRYERALALKRAPRILYNLGLAYQNLRRFVEALESYRAFLVEMAPDDKPNEQAARDAIAELEKKVAKLDIRITPETDAKVTLTIDGILVPEAAMGYPRLVDPGEHTVLARAKGYHDAKQIARVAEGEQLAVTLELELLNKPRKDPTKPGSGGPDKPKVPVLPTVLIAGGAATFAIGVTVGLVGVQKALDAPTRDGKDADEARSMALAGDIVGAVGLAAAGAGVTLLLLDKFGKHSAQPKKSTSTWVMPLVTTNGVGVVGRF